jgi:hypothetical protein
MPSIILLVDLGLGLTAIYLLKRLLSPSSGSSSSKAHLGKLPPGPKPKPLIGNLLDLPTSHDWLHWAKHKALYGASLVW